jgi:hypothetical protein
VIVLCFWFMLIGAQSRDCAHHPDLVMSSTSLLEKSSSILKTALPCTLSDFRIAISGSLVYC